MIEEVGLWGAGSAIIFGTIFVGRYVIMRRSGIGANEIMLAILTVAGLVIALLSLVLVMIRRFVP